MSGKQLEGIVAVITGGGRSIGRSIAIAFAGAGAKLVLVARTASQLETATNDISSMGSEAHAIVTDVTDNDEVTAMANQIRTVHDRVDILVNNAGGGVESNHVVDSDPSLWIQDVNVNLVSAYLVTHAILPLMQQAGGKIINTGSGMGHIPGAGSSAYHVGKAGMWILTRCLADEV